MAEQDRRLLNIAVVDDHHMVIKGLASMLANWPYGRVMLQANNGLEYEEHCRSTAPVDITFMDLSMPVRDGYATIAWMVQHQPWTVPLAISFNPTEEVVERARQAGAYSVLSKTVDPDTLLRVLDEVREHEFLHKEPRGMRRTRRADGFRVVDDSRLPELTEREREFIRHYCDASCPTVKEVAHRMGISVHTAEEHKANVYRKLLVDNRQAFYRKVMASGLLVIG